MGPWFFDPTTHEDFNEVWGEVGATGCEQLVSQHIIRFAHEDGVAVIKADVDIFISVADEAEEIHVGSNLAAALGERAFACDLNRVQLGKRRHPSSCLQGIKQRWGRKLR